MSTGESSTTPRDRLPAPVGVRAYLAFLDDFQTSGIFVGSGAEPVISTGDELDGAIVSNLSFCGEGLNDSGDVAFIATLDAADGSGFRTAVFRATRQP